jgi:heme/copper-type cytochrome/quinol oxidase subunit 2
MSNRSLQLAWALILLAALPVAFAPFPTGTPAEPVTRLFHVQASQSSYSPSELRVNRGDTVTISLTSTDAVHGLYVDGYDISVQADPGQTASLTFVADKPGSFRFRCNVTCGALHPFLIGKLMVGSDTLLYRSVGITLLGALGLMLSLGKQPRVGMLV